METLKITKNEAVNLYNGLIDVKDVKNKQFALKVAKNINIIREALKDIEEAGMPSEEFVALTHKVQAIMKKDPENGHEDIQKLEDENKELVEKRKEQLNIVNQKLAEDCELELNIFSEDSLPEDITAKQINNIVKIIE